MHEILLDFVDSILSTGWLAILPTARIMLVDDEPGIVHMAAERTLSPEECHDRNSPGEHAHGQYGVPIWCDDRMLGVLAVYPSHGQLRDEEIKFLESVAGMLAIVIRQHRLQEDLQKREKRYRELAENAADIIMECDLDGRVRYISPSIKRLIGYSAEEIVGRKALALVHPDDQGRVWAEGVASLANSSGMPIEQRVIRKDGVAIWVESHPKLFFDSVTGEPCGVADILRDISERKVLEDELIRAKLQAQRASKAKSEFLANMSHELRTPLNAILGFSEMITHEILGPAPRYCIDYARDIHASGTHLLALINDILDLSKLESGKYQLNEAAVEFGVVLQEALQLVKPQATARAIAIRVDHLDALRLRIDVRLIKQVLLNLFSNAIKFTPEGGRVSVAMSCSTEKGIRVSIIDNGVGMTEEEIEIALAPFGQVNSQIAGDQMGTGLGLPICKSLIELHGGTFQVTSRPGRGTTITIWLPPDRIIATATENAA